MTGAGGLIGRALVAVLAGDPRVEDVVAIDVCPLDAIAGGKARTVRRDVRDPGIAADLRDTGAVVHLAFREIDPRGGGQANLDGARNVFEAAIAAGAGTIVHASSASVYGSAPGNPVPLGEGHPMRPARTFAYPRTKAIVEGMLDEIGARHHGVRIVRLRPSTTLGPGMALLLGRRAYMSFSDFDPPMQFTWVDDVAAAFAAALQAPRASGVFNVGAPGTVRASEVAGILGVRSVRLPYRVRRGASVAMKRLGIPGALDPGFVDANRYPIVVDASRAEAELGWTAERDTVGALRRFAETL